MRETILFWIFISVTIGFSLATTLYKRVIPETHSGLAFKVPVDGFPKSAKSNIVCGAITAGLMKTPLFSTSKMDYVNAFHFGEDKSCNPVKLRPYALANTHPFDQIEGSGWYLHQGCHVNVLTDAETIAGMPQGNLGFYFPGAGDALMYQNTTTPALQTPATYRPTKFPSFGTPFFNGRSSFRAKAGAAIQDYAVKYFYLQRQRRSMPDNSCCCGEKVQNGGLEARYSHRPLHNYCREYKIKVIK